MSAIALLSESRLDALVSARNAAVYAAERVALALQAANDDAGEGMSLAAAAYGQSPHWAGMYGDGIFAHARTAARDTAARVEAERKRIDASVWMMFYAELGLWDVMSTRQRAELTAELEGDPPVVTADAARARMEAVIGGAAGMVRQAFAEAFTALDRRFKSNDPACLRAIGCNRATRIIFTRAADDSGHCYASAAAWSRIADVERIFATLDDRRAIAGDDGEAPASLIDAVKTDRAGVWKPHQSETVSRYFKVRIFKNGNAHLWFTRPDLVERVNIELAAYYGAVLPDGVPKCEPEVTTAVAKNLSFYRTPPEVVRRLMAGMEYGDPQNVLEPSAGDGAIVCALRELGHDVEAVEVDPARCSTLRRIDGMRLKVRRANFLRMAPRADFDAVVMNPPFYGTHWMAHVKHAFDFLKPGGMLRAVLPITADLGTSKAHRDFRAWAAPRLDGWHHDKSKVLDDLPLGAFKASGTMVSTGVLTLRKN